MKVDGNKCGTSDGLLGGNDGNEVVSDDGTALDILDGTADGAKDGVDDGEREEVIGDKVMVGSPNDLHGKPNLVLKTEGMID